MPTLPWTPTADLDLRREHFVLATRFVVRHRHHIPAVVRSTQTLWSGFATTDGLLGYSLRASLGSSTLSTLTVWRDRDAMTTFVRGEPHVSIVHQTSRWLAEARFASWTAMGVDLPPSWQAATEQLDGTSVQRVTRAITLPSTPAVPLVPRAAIRRQER